MAFQPDDLLSEAALEAAVAALAERNQHHLADMNEVEQSDAVGHWRELAMTVLTAARTASGPGLAEGESGGRAAIVLEDAGGDEITVHASFYPQLEDLGGGEVAATPAQATALELLEQLAGEDEGEDEPLACSALRRPEVEPLLGHALRLTGGELRVASVVGVVHVVVDRVHARSRARVLSDRAARGREALRRRVVDTVARGRAAVLERVRHAQPVADLVRTR